MATVRDALGPSLSTLIMDDTLACVRDTVTSRYLVSRWRALSNTPFAKSRALSWLKGKDPAALVDPIPLERN